MSLLGELLTREQCWEEYENMLQSDIAYDRFEMGLGVQEEEACISLDAAFQQMDEFYLSVEAYESQFDLPPQQLAEHYESHHLQVVSDPYWHVCVDRISQLLK
jgi:hypothetical protein